MEEIAIGGKDGVRQRLLKPHAEKHFTAGEMVRDVIMGMSDGLTVPFALAAGLSGADASSSIILTAGLAEVAAGAISMGLGGYLAAKSESDHYRREQRREQEEIISVPERLPRWQTFLHSMGWNLRSIGQWLMHFKNALKHGLNS